jgi:hypothetical protein
MFEEFLLWDFRPNRKEGWGPFVYLLSFLFTFEVAVTHLNYKIVLPICLHSAHCAPPPLKNIKLKVDSELVFIGYSTPMSDNLKKPSFLFQPGNTHARERQLDTIDLLQCSSVTGLLNESNSLSAAFGVTKFVAVFATNLVTLRCSTTDTYIIVNFRHLCFNKQALLKWAC